MKKALGAPLLQVHWCPGVAAPWGQAAAQPLYRRAGSLHQKCPPRPRGCLHRFPVTHTLPCSHPCAQLCPRRPCIHTRVTGEQEGEGRRTFSCLRARLGGNGSYRHFNSRISLFDFFYGPCLSELEYASEDTRALLSVRVARAGMEQL